MAWTPVRAFCDPVPTWFSVSPEMRFLITVSPLIFLGPRFSHDETSRMRTTHDFSDSSPRIFPWHGLAWLVLPRFWTSSPRTSSYYPLSALGATCSSSYFEIFFMFDRGPFSELRFHSLERSMFSGWIASISLSVFDPFFFDFGFRGLLF